VLKCVSNDAEGVYGCVWTDDQCIPQSAIECKNYSENVCRNYMANYCFWNVDGCLSPLEVTDCSEIKNTTECVGFVFVRNPCFAFGFGCNEVKNSYFGCKLKILVNPLNYIYKCY
jgi:hypothetical protein